MINCIMQSAYSSSAVAAGSQFQTPLALAGAPQAPTASTSFVRTSQLYSSESLVGPSWHAVAAAPNTSFTQHQYQQSAAEAIASQSARVVPFGYPGQHENEAIRTALLFTPDLVEK